MTESTKETENFEFRVDRTMLYHDLERRILLKLLPPNGEKLLALLKMTHNERWNAYESGDHEKENSLKLREEELIDKIIGLANPNDLTQK